MWSWIGKIFMQFPKQKQNEPLCPLLNPITSGYKRDAYKSIFCNVNRFRVINGLSTELKFGSDETLELHNFTPQCPLWYRSCHVKCSNQSLQWKKQRKKYQCTLLMSSHMAPKHQALDVEKCLFCENLQRRRYPSWHFRHLMQITNIQAMN